MPVRIACHRCWPANRIHFPSGKSTRLCEPQGLLGIRRSKSAIGVERVGDAITLTERGWERPADSDEMRIPPAERQLSRLSGSIALLPPRQLRRLLPPFPQSTFAMRSHFVNHGNKRDDRAGTSCDAPGNGDHHFPMSTVVLPKSPCFAIRQEQEAQRASAGGATTIIVRSRTFFRTGYFPQSRQPPNRD